MSKRETYEEKTWDLLQPVLEELRLRAVDVEFVKEGGEYYLRCYIDKDGGVGIDDCENVSRRIDPLLDTGDFIDEAYTLEVSSPGLGRPLKRPRDYEYAKDREVEIRTFKGIDGRKEWKGVLVSWDKDTVMIRDEAGEDRTFSKKEISLIRLAMDF